MSATVATSAVVRGGRRALQRGVDGVARRALSGGVPPGWTGYRGLRYESVFDLCARTDSTSGELPTVEIVQPAADFSNPLPRNITHRDELPRDRGWWGYSMHDVPSRHSSATWVAHLDESSIVGYLGGTSGRDYYPAVLTAGSTALVAREMQLRPGHRRMLAAHGRSQRLERATWILERVYHNHSHWLTSHLPKLLLLRERGELADLVLPQRLTPAMDTTLRRIGIDADSCHRIDPVGSIEVDRLTIVGNDRFRPELLRSVNSAFVRSDSTSRSTPTRRVYISRAGADRRRLRDEHAIWPVLADRGFDKVEMERLSMDDQIELMNDTAILVGPHGAGLTNMIFCPPGAAVVEIADLAFPNPNFYAMAAALGHDYWHVPASSVGEGAPLERDLELDVDSFEAIVPALVDSR